MELTPGELVMNGEYCIVERLGAGGFGRVYQARHQLLQTFAAIKILQRGEGGVGSTTFKDMQDRYLQEARLGAQIRHPNIIHVDHFKQEGDTLYLVMEYAEGGSLEEKLRPRHMQDFQPLTWQETVRIMKGAAQGLAALHAKDVVHRDIKPSNLLFGRDNQVKIADLGLAQAPHGASRRDGISSDQAPHHPGTPGYMSPEQASTFKALSTASDIYSLGVTAFLMLTGRLVGGGIKPGTPPSGLITGVPDWLDRLVLAMLAEEPRERPWNGEELLERLEAAGREAAEGERQAAEERAKAEMEARMRAELEEKFRQEQTEKEKWEAEAQQEAERQKSLVREGQPLALDLENGIRLDLIWVPSGSFWMGSDENYDWEKPRHQVNLAGFWMGKYVVTNAQYRVFTRESQHSEPRGGFPAGKDAHPVVNVSWHDVMAFVRWLDQKVRGKLGQGMCLRLPTEAEWEKAARGADGRLYPWGDGEPTADLCNFRGSKIETTTPVGKYSPRGDSHYGCADMAGNVWEWTYSLYQPYPYQTGDGREVEGGGPADRRVLRGGSFLNDADFLRCGCRNLYFPGIFNLNFGFRVCVGPILT